MISPETLDAIIGDIRGGGATRNVLTAHEVACGTFYAALDSDKALAERYARARAGSMDAIADDAMRIADDPDIDHNHKRIMVDARKWFLSKLAPKKYGDKLDLGSDPDRPLITKVVREIVRTPDQNG